MTRRPHSWKDYPLRVSRSDAIAIVNRGGDYVLHAGAHLQEGRYRTACGLQMYGCNEHDGIADWTSCKRCRRALGEKS